MQMFLGPGVGEVICFGTEWVDGQDWPTAKMYKAKCQGSNNNMGEVHNWERRTVIQLLS